MFEYYFLDITWDATLKSFVHTQITGRMLAEESKLKQKLNFLPFPMCLRVFSIVEFLFTFDNRPRQKRSALFDGFVNPST